MRVLYYLSFVLHLPFTLVGVLFELLGVGFRWLGDSIHDLITYRIWLVLHRRECYRRAERSASPDWDEEI